MLTHSTIRMAKRMAAWLRPSPQLAGVVIASTALVAIEIQRARGRFVPAPTIWTFLAAGVATAIAGWYVGLASTLLAIYCSLEFYDHPSGIPDRLHIAQIAWVAMVSILIAEVLRRRNQAARHEASARSAAEASRLSEERFSTALRAAPIFMFSQDRDLRYTWFHSASVDIPRDEILGRFDTDLFNDSQDLPKLLSIKRWVLETGGRVRQELSLRYGSIRSLDVTIEPLHDAAGRISGLTGAAVDISDLKRTLEIVREQELVLAKAQQIANIGSWEIQVEPHHVVWSDQMYRIFGLAPREFSPSIHTVLPHIHPQDQQTAKMDLQHLMRGGAPLCRELRILRPDGATRRLLAQADRVPDQPGQPTRIVGTVLDITERKRAEEQLQALNASLEQRIAERTAIAEHRAAQLRRLASELTLAEQKERRRLAQLLHDHLQQLLVGAKLGISIARGQPHESAMHQSLTQVNEMLDESIRLSRSLSVELYPPILYESGLSAALQWLAGWMREKYDLQIDLATDPQAEPGREDVRALLFQATRELLFNIVKHAGVKQARLVMSRLNDDRVRIVVADSGRGFDGARVTHGHGKGTGFGLVSIRERLELLGGHIEVHSKPGHGTRILLLAPIQLPAEQLATPSTPPPPRTLSCESSPQSGTEDIHDGRRIRVLLADDHKIVREGLANLLRTWQTIEVIGEAGDGQAAVDMARQIRPDVVLMDIVMPRLSGIEATRIIAAELPDVRVIGLSMYVESDMAAAMHEAGAACYLSKSSDPDTVIRTIEACFRPDQSCQASCPAPSPAPTTNDFGS